MSSVETPVFSRPGEAADEIAGLRPAAVFAPTSAEESQSLLRETARDGLRLVFAGGRTDIELGAPPAALDAVVETRRLARILEYAPSDQIVVAESGVTLKALQDTLAPRGQRLALDPPAPERATVGGVVAANAFGPSRHRYGSVRDLLIGIDFVRADGVPARGGGKVVKNVAGFDLPKLMTGSLGTLGFITSATFRLHPLPETVATVVSHACSPSRVRALVCAIRAAALEPAAIAAIGGVNGLFDVGIRVEGFRAGMFDQRDRVASLAAAAGDRVELPDGPAAEAFWAAHDSARSAGTVRARLSAPPADFEAAASRDLGGVSSTLDDLRQVWYPALGLGFLSGRPADPAAAGAALAEARRALEARGGSLVLALAPPGVRRVLDAWGTPPPSLGLMRAVKDRMDPERRLASGRFVGGI